jgi:hypothetical protein
MISAKSMYIQCEDDVMAPSGATFTRICAKRSVRALAVVPAAACAVALAGPAAATCDRPVNVAWVVANPVADLKADGSVVVSEKIACRPGWDASDLTVRVAQASGAYADGLLLTNSNICNGRWHYVKVTLPKGFGTLQKGWATVSSQFLVFNSETGDPAAGHENKRTWLRKV